MQWLRRITLGLFDKVFGKESGAIKLSKPEAFAAVAVAAVASDGNISPEEVQRTVTDLSTIQLFRSYDLRDLANTLNKAAGLLRRRGPAPVIEAVKAALGEEHLETAFLRSCRLGAGGRSSASRGEEVLGGIAAYPPNRWGHSLENCGCSAHKEPGVRSLSSLNVCPRIHSDIPKKL
jgi:hypothetical protein